MYRSWVQFVAVLSIGIGWPLMLTASPQHYALPGHGSLLLNVPDTWKSELKQGDGGSPPTVGLSPKSGPPFLVLVSAIWGQAPGAGAPDDAKIRATVASMAKGAESQSTEGSLSLQDLTGSGGHGYYFSATDRAPPPGEWKFLTQGMIRTGAIALTFTILTNDGQSSVPKAALEMIRLAVQQPLDSV